MFNEREYPFKLLVSKYPERTKRDMILSFEKGGITPNDVVKYLPLKDVIGKEFNSFEEVFELDIRGFEHGVLIGKSKEKQQLGIEDFIKFEPKVIK
ncbi:hypothetical protein PBV87_09155 [Niameybacter massiliensis]|uniref:Uncharacterized protein n=1 Tax=Holtiella tumoricola TaxID=3018743 RepID=A0AA42J0N0_9FIRM|nr:hypothetical protein [Holtiella tumoricola]MDA3731642.1 hypothetical protein [Holtiella tumoricola]